MLIDDVLETGVAPAKADFIAWGEGVEVNAISSKHFDIVADGTDQTTKIEDAIDSGENIHFERGVIGVDGDAGLSLLNYGTQWRGAGTTYVATHPTRGTVFKRLAGTGPLITVPIYTEGILIRDMCFDGNGIAGIAVDWMGHRGVMRNIIFHNQVTNYALVVSGSNLCEFDNLGVTGTLTGLLHCKPHAVALYGSLYSVFRRMITLNGGSLFSMLIERTGSATFENTFNEGTIKLTNGSNDVRFDNLRGEMGAGVEFFQVDSVTSGCAAIAVKGGSVNCYEDRGFIPFFRITDSANFSLEDFIMTDAFGAAGATYIRTNNADGFSIRDCTASNGTGNAHYLLQSDGVRSDNMEIANIKTNGTVLSELDMSGMIRGGNMPVTFRAAGTSQLVTAIGVQANINSDNCSSGLLLIGCNNVTDAGRVAHRVGYGGSIPTFRTAVSAAELVLEIGDKTEQTYSVSGTTAITSIRAADSIPGREVTLVFQGVLNFTHGNNIDIGATVATTAGTTIKLLCNIGGTWVGVSSRAN